MQNGFNSLDTNSSAFGFKVPGNYLLAEDFLGR